MAVSVSSLLLPPTTTTAAVPFRRVSFSTQANPPQNTSSPPSPPPPEKKSFAVATGELFLGIASRVLIKGGKITDGGEEKEKIGAVVEDPVQPEVVWEQMVEDVEAERRRKAVTSPGFSFSAAGLLFPYHLGVAQLLIEEGYIKVLCSYSRKQHHWLVLQL
ncbi:patatin-like phospholipase domain-containing protein 2, partial [Phtheirospermum japonicum]